jgi:hypothetical protein
VIQSHPSTISEAVFTSAWVEYCRTDAGRQEYWRRYSDYLFKDPPREIPRELLSLPPGFRPAPKPRRQRKPSIKKMIAAAERSGKTVTSLTTPDGVTLRFGESDPTEANNPWLVGIDDKVTKQ